MALIGKIDARQVGSRTDKIQHVVRDQFKTTSWTNAWTSLLAEWTNTLTGFLRSLELNLAFYVSTFSELIGDRRLT